MVLLTGVTFGSSSFFLGAGDTELERCLQMFTHPSDLGLEGCFPVELPVMTEAFYTVLSNVVAPSHMWPWSTYTTHSVTETPKFEFYLHEF